MAKTLEQWFTEYSESHRNPINKLVHWICVPVIFFSIVSLLSLIPIYGKLNGAVLAMSLATMFYIRLSMKLTIGIILFFILCYCGTLVLEQFFLPVWLSAFILFSLAWIGQFWGHHIEGKKPSFLKDLQFLLIGPAWLLGFIYNHLNIKLP